MKIRLYSDIHNEFRRGNEWYPPVLPDEKSTVLVLAGDVDVGYKLVRFVDVLAERFLAVVYILGNHELYGENIDELGPFRSLKNNTYFLNNSTVTIEDVEFVGTTLWTDMNGANPLAMLSAPEVMNDFRKIRQGETYRRFTSDRWIVENQRARKFLADTITMEKKQVVVTHHAPDYLCAEGNPYAGNENDVYYYNGNLHDVIGSTTLWMFGHCHHAFDKYFGDLRIVSNPRGYDDGTDVYLVPGFDDNGSEIEV